MGLGDILQETVAPPGTATGALPVAKSGMSMKKIKIDQSRIHGFNAWNMDLEVGDYIVDHNGILYRLTESKGRNKAASGELTPKNITPNGKRAIKVDEVWFWQ